EPGADVEADRADELDERRPEVERLDVPAPHPPRAGWCAAVSVADRDRVGELAERRRGEEDRADEERHGHDPGVDVLEVQRERTECEARRSDHESEGDLSALGMLPAPELRSAHAPGPTPGKCLDSYAWRTIRGIFRVGMVRFSGRTRGRWGRSRAGWTRSTPPPRRCLRRARRPDRG